MGLMPKGGQRLSDSYAARKAAQGWSAVTWHFVFSVKLDDYSVCAEIYKLALLITEVCMRFWSWLRHEIRLTKLEKCSVMRRSSE